MYPSSELKPAVKRMLQTDTLNDGNKNTYAYGISISELRGTELIAHSGSWASFNTYLMLLPSYDLSIVVLNNNGRSASTIARQIASFYLPTDADINKKKDLPLESKELVLPPKLLDEYTGTYKLGTAWYVHLSQENDRLWVQATDEDKFPMKVVSDSVLLIKEYGNRTMKICRNENDEVTHLIYNGMVCRKMSNSTTFSLENPQEYIGDYFSAELNTLYKVIFKEGQLKLWHLHNGEIDLDPAWNDEFTGSKWYANTIRFQRADTGEITGLSISQSRAKNQLFRKVSIRQN